MRYNFQIPYDIDHTTIPGNNFYLRQVELCTLPAPQILTALARRSGLAAAVAAYDRGMSVPAVAGGA